MGKFIVKCDVCKKTVKRRVSFGESVRGTTCFLCKKKKTPFGLGGKRL